MNDPMLVLILIGVGSVMGAVAGVCIHFMSKGRRERKIRQRR